MHQIRFQLRLHPRPRWESSQHLRCPYLLFKDPASKGRYGRKEKGKERKGRRKDGRGKQARLPILIPGYTIARLQAYAAYAHSGVCKSLTWEFGCSLVPDQCHFDIIYSQPYNNREIVDPYNQQQQLLLQQLQQHSRFNPDNDQHIATISCILGKDTQCFNVGQSALPLRLIEVNA